MQARPQATYQLTRFCIQRALAFVYCIGFLIVIHQYLPLLGEDGLTPARVYLDAISFWRAPSLFWFLPSDTFLLTCGWMGLMLALVALTGISDAKKGWISTLIWGLLWLLYLSFVNSGFLFYSFGWETLLLETGFLAIFLGSTKTAPSKAIIWFLRWELFRIMFGAGLIKLRGDSCWTDLTCMYYYYETQPVPNPLSWYFHHLPLWFHKLEIVFTHFVELIVPWGYLIPWRPVRYTAGILTFIFHGVLILSGNLSWLNYITLVVALSCFDDAFFSKLIRLKLPKIVPMKKPRKAILAALTVLLLVLSINPALNMISSRQMMNASFEPLHLLNTYGAFGSITKTRHEIILQGTDETTVTPKTKWLEYEFKCKPGDVSKVPCLMSPYHYRLDWQIWFAAMSPYQHNPWMLNLVAKLLENNERTTTLIAENPFPNKPPKFIRAELFKYEFTSPAERRESGNWWKRKYVRPYLPPLSKNNDSLKRVLSALGWASTQERDKSIPNP